MPRLTAASATVNVDPRRALVTEIVLPGKVGMSAVKPAALLEVTDLSAGVTYSPLTSKFRAGKPKTSSAGGKKSVSFAVQYAGAPFRIVQTFSETPAGVRWDAAIKLAAGEKANRSLRVRWVLPAPGGWAFWGPQDTTVYRNDGATPRRYVYGHMSFRPYGTMIPLVATWGEKSGLAAFSPPDVQKPYMAFDLATQHIPASVRGIAPTIADLPQTHVTYHHVGLRPGKELKLSVCLAGVKPSWRSALGHYVKSYPELFEVVAATRKCEGMYGISNPTRLARGDLKRMTDAGVTFLEVHGHFPEYSVYIEPEALADPKLTWRCKPHPSVPLSLAGNRRCIDQLRAAGIAPFMYWYNCHALPDTINRRWPGSTMRDEKRRPLLKWYTEPSVWGPPDSPFGRHMIRQMELLLKAYPKMAGLFVDNYAIEMYDFSHDDGVTTVHDKPAYDLNRNHQLLGPPCFDMAHAAGKVIMVNKISTVESLRGADMVLAETRGVASIRKHALACVFRPLFPLAMELPEGPHGAERGCQHLLLNGCFPDDALYRADPAAMAAYRPLTDAMIGKRYVLDEPDPLTVPAASGPGPAASGQGSPGLQGEIYRIDRAAPHGGSVVVALVDLNKSYTAPDMTRGLQVTVRLPEAARLKKATWLAVEKCASKSADAGKAAGAGKAAARSRKPTAPKPVTCRMRRRGREITISLPPVGAAGILRLER